MDLLEGILERKTRAVARMLRLIEDRPDEARPILKKLYPHTGKAYLIGLTGSPGVGKSSLVDRLVGLFRAQGLTVAVVAVDPTSPFSGGAVLGDRVRMQAHATDPGVFIRSLATRGSFGGLTPAVKGVVQVLDAAGFDRVLIETVGVGQDEVDIVRLAHSTVVVTVPGLGDEVQAIKAGIMEIADLLVVNKADREGAERTVQELKSMIEMNRLTGQEKEWWPIIQPVSAKTGENLEELLAQLDAHREFLTAEKPEVMTAKLRRHLSELVVDLVKEEIVRKAQAALDSSADWDHKLDDLVDRTLDPYTLAEELLKKEVEKG